MFLPNDYRFYRYQYHTSHHTDMSKGCDLHYLALLQKGSVSIVTPVQTLRIREGEVFYLPRGLSYHSYWQGTPQIEFVSFGFLTMPVRDQKSYIPQTIPHAEKLAVMLTQIPIQGTQVGSYALSLFYAALSEAVSLMSHNPDSILNSIADQAMGYIRKHPHAQVPEIARACGVSQPYLYDKFRSATGTSPNKYRQRILCSLAVELLTTTDRTVEDISNQLHFSSPSYFRKVLFQRTGLTPRQIRAQENFRKGN